MKFSTVSILAAIVVNSASAFTIPLQNARMSSTMTSSLRMKGDSPFVGYDSPAPDAANCPPDQPIPPPPPATPIPAGYVGTFAESNPNFAYPKVLPDLTSIPVTTNLANIDKLTRQQKVEWPEFSWQMIQEDDSSRLYMTFAEYVSRMGYDDEGKVVRTYSLFRSLPIYLVFVYCTNSCYLTKLPNNCYYLFFSGLLSVHNKDLELIY